MKGGTNRWRAGLVLILLTAGGPAGCTTSWRSAQEALPPMPAYGFWEFKAEKPKVCAVVWGECVSTNDASISVANLEAFEKDLAKTGHRIVRRAGDLQAGRYFVTRADRLAVERLIEVCEQSAMARLAGYHVVVVISVSDVRSGKRIGSCEVQGQGTASYWETHDPLDKSGEYERDKKEAVALGKAAGIQKPDIDCHELPVARERAIKNALWNAVRCPEFAELLEK